MTESIVKLLQRRYGGDVDNELSASLSHATSPTFWGMMQYQLGYVDDRLQPIQSAGGKRFRSSLCLLACESVGGNRRDAMRLAAGIELLHNFSLIHDDIEDGDPLRRHRPTVWRVWGEPQAINAGDGMFALANHVVLRGVAEIGAGLEVAVSYMDTAVALTEGQYLDMSFESRLEVSSAEYIEMIACKTAALIRFSLWAGAAAGGATPETCDLLRIFGEHLGLAFQIHDDIMGIWGDPSVTGKEAAQDLRKRKKTLPVLMAWERADARAKESLGRFYAGVDDDVDHVLAIVGTERIEREARAVGAEHLFAALHALDQVAIAPADRHLFSELARELTGYRWDRSPDTVANA